MAQRFVFVWALKLDKRSSKERNHTPSTGTCRNLKKWPPTELIRRPCEIVNLIPTGEIWRSYSQPKLCDDLDLTEGVEQKKGLSRYIVCCHFKVAGYCLFLLFCKISSCWQLCHDYQLHCDFVSSDDGRVFVTTLFSKYWTHQQYRFFITAFRFLVLVWL